MVRTCDKVSSLLQHAGQRGHPSATDAHEVDMMWILGLHIEGGGECSKGCVIVIFEFH